MIFRFNACLDFSVAFFFVVVDFVFLPFLHSKCEIVAAVQGSLADLFYCYNSSLYYFCKLSQSRDIYLIHFYYILFWIRQDGNFYFYFLFNFIVSFIVRFHRERRS